MEHKSEVKINREIIKKALDEMCGRLRTDEIDVQATEDTRKLDAGIVYYIVHVRRMNLRRAPITRKTGVYFTRVKDRIHVQVINGTSMVMLYSNYSENSQTEVFRYLENMIKTDVEFYKNKYKPEASRPVRKEGHGYGNRKK